MSPKEPLETTFRIDTQLCIGTVGSLRVAQEQHGALGLGLSISWILGPGRELTA